MTDEFMRGAPERLGICLQRPPDGAGIEPFFENFLVGLEEGLDHLGTRVFVLMVDSTEEELEVYPRWAADGLVDTVVLVDLASDDPRVPLLARLGMTVVVLGHPVPATDFTFVEVDNAAAMRMAVEFLVGLGHRRLGRVSGPVRLTHVEERTAAFEESVAAAGAVGWSVEGDYGTESARAMTAHLLALPTPPTAIVYDNDVMAVAGEQYALECGIQVPGELSVLAWDDSAGCRVAEPPLSAISRDAHELGSMIAQALGEGRQGTSHVVRTADAQIIVRGSTAPPLSAAGAR